MADESTPRSVTALVASSVGIDEEELIFKSLKSARSAAKAAGLGLHVSRLLARMMAGDVSYSRRDGLTVFRLELPAVKRSAD